jgi:hypothetical protein
MFENGAQAALDEALSTGAATYEISHRRNALVLSVRKGHRLIPFMDKLFGISDLDFVPDVHRNATNAVPVLTIGEYAVAPKFERREIEGYQIYELMYSKRG